MYTTFSSRLRPRRRLPTRLQCFAVGSNDPVGCGDVGERLGRGEKIGAILFSLTAVAEGYHTACSAHQLAQKLRITTPIINEVYAMLYEGKDAGHALRDLLSRELKSED